MRITFSKIILNTYMSGFGTKSDKKQKRVEAFMKPLGFLMESLKLESHFG